MTNGAIATICAVVAVCAEVAENAGIIGYWPAAMIASAFILVSGYYLHKKRKRVE